MSKTNTQESVSQEDFDYLAKNQEGKILCQRCCVNPAVCQSGNRPEWLCRSCVENDFNDYGEDEIEADDSLIFCETEWNAQE